MIFDKLAKVFGLSRQAAQIEDSRHRAHTRMKHILDEVVAQNQRTSMSLTELVRELQAMRDEDAAIASRSGTHAVRRTSERE